VLERLRPTTEQVAERIRTVQVGEPATSLVEASATGEEAT
jgi:hypothetical protein